MKIRITPIISTKEIEHFKDYFDEYFNTDFQVTIKQSGIDFDGGA